MCATMGLHCISMASIIFFHMQLMTYFDKQILMSKISSFFLHSYVNSRVNNLFWVWNFIKGSGYLSGTGRLSSEANHPVPEE